MKISEEMYTRALEVVEKYLAVDDTDNLSDEELKELDFHSQIVEAYEEEHYPIGMPSLIDVIRLRMFEMNLKQKDLANLLEVSATRVSEYLKGRRDITLDVAKRLHQKLNIDADIILQ